MKNSLKRFLTSTMRVKRIRDNSRSAFVECLTVNTTSEYSVIHPFILSFVFSFAFSPSFSIHSLYLFFLYFFILFFVFLIYLSFFS